MGELRVSAPGDNTPHGNGSGVMPCGVAVKVELGGGVSAPGHHADDLEWHGAAEPDEYRKVALTEEKLVCLKLYHVAIGSHPHDEYAAEHVKWAELSVCGEPETIDSNCTHPDVGTPNACMSGCGHVRPDIGMTDLPPEVGEPACIA